MPLLFNIHKQGLFLDVIVISRSTASAPATTARARNNLADIFSSFYNKKKKKEKKKHKTCIDCRELRGNVNNILVGSSCTHILARSRLLLRSPPENIV